MSYEILNLTVRKPNKIITLNRFHVLMLYALTLKEFNYDKFSKIITEIENFFESS